MDQPARTFRQYLDANPDPHAGNAGALQEAHRLVANGGPTAAQLFAQCDSALRPTFYMGCTPVPAPVLLIAPYTADELGLPPTGEKYAYSRDVSDDGNIPPILAIDQGAFDEVGPVEVPDTPTFMVQFQGRPAGDDAMAPPVAASEQVTTRNIWPIPYPYIRAILQQQHYHDLKWEWIYNNVITPIMTDPAQLAAYQLFIDWVRVSSTLQAAAAGGPHLAPATNLNYEAVFGLARPLLFAMPMARRFLPGVGQPQTTGLDQHMINLVQQQQQFTTTVAQMQNRPAQTLESSNPQLYHMALRMAEVHRETDLPEAWTIFPRLQRGQVYSWMESTVAERAHQTRLAKPVFGPPFSTDFGTGRWLPSNINDYTHGFVITRIATEFSPPNVLEEQRERNRVFNTLVIFPTGGDGRAASMALHDWNAQWPTTTSELRAQLEAFYTLFTAMFGAGNSLMTNYRANVVDRIHEIERLIRLNYTKCQADACLRVLIMVFRCFNEAFEGLMNGPIPTAAVPIPRPQDHIPFRDVEQCLLRGNILTQIDLIEQDILRPVPGRETPAPAPASAPAPAAAAGSGGRTDTITITNQNRDLKLAWSNSGHTGIYGVGCPYHDPSSSDQNKRKIIMRQSGNTRQRICLPMALKGQCYRNCTGYHGSLTSAEVQSVAAAGGLQL